MGGVGSGNFWRDGTKQVCEVQKRIELPYLRRTGFLAPKFYGHLDWSIRGESSGYINFQIQYNGITLIYRSRDHGQKVWQDIEELIPFVFTSQNFGGQRQWFECLSCKQRCSVLYGGRYFRCRKCSGLAYQSQNETTHGRALLKARKIRKRLGGSDDLFEFFPPKPKGMHWRTYYALENENMRIEIETEKHLQTMLNG